MVKLILFLNLLIISSVMSRNFKRGVSRPFIIGGDPADIRHHPFQISIRTKSWHQHICGGAIISEKFVITAAHCLYSKDSRDYYIWVGSTKLSGYGYRYEIERSFWHEHYSDPTHHQDIGLIGVKNKFVFRDTIKPISILLNEVPPGNILSVTGWGYAKYSETNKVNPDNLQKNNLMVHSLKDCHKIYAPREIITNAQICTFVKNRKAGVCMGDSGGPLTYHGYLVALVSWGIACAVGYPDVHTKVAPYMNWINGSIKKYCQNRPCPKNSFPKYVKS